MFKSHVSDEMLFEFEGFVTCITGPGPFVEMYALDMGLQVSFQLELFVADFTLELTEVIVYFHVGVKVYLVNKQDFLQVFQGSGITLAG